MRALWQGVTADFGTSNITVKNNYIVDSVKRGIWFLGTTDSVATHNFVENSGADGIKLLRSPIQLTDKTARVGDGSSLEFSQSNRRKMFQRVSRLRLRKMTLKLLMLPVRRSIKIYAGSSFSALIR